MESLSDETWDLVIVGTSLPQSLLALSLSRSDLRILHVDQNRYYGGDDAGLSIDEAETWAALHQASTINASATIFRNPDTKELAASRLYTLSLNPQIIYASSDFLPLVVTSRLHNQLDFLAVGSWWILKNSKLQRIPSTREDVFADEALSRKDKIGLMKFLRYVLQGDSTSDEAETDVDQDMALTEALSTKFRIPSTLQSQVAALALAKQPASSTSFMPVVSNIRRHMKSMNHFGPGFAAVYPKYAGNAEIAQAACRAGAVGGTVYLLGQGVASVEHPRDTAEPLRVQLANGTVVQAKRVIGSSQNMLLTSTVEELAGKQTTDTTQLNTIAVISSPLTQLFPQTSDNGPVPAVAVVHVENESSSEAPVYLQVHSEDTGECPSGQCCIYASVLVTDNDLEAARNRLKSAIGNILPLHVEAGVDEKPGTVEQNAKILWSMTYPSLGLRQSDIPFQADPSRRMMLFPARTHDMALDDSIITSVKAVWREIRGEKAADEEFLVFEEWHQEDDQ